MSANPKPVGSFSALAVIVKFRSEGRHALSNYIADELRRTGYQFSQPVLLRRLRSLESSGFITTDGIPMGLYGFRWELTDKGREFRK